MGGSVMASIINATTTGLTVTPDNSGQLTLSANGVTALTANTAGNINFAKQPTIGGVEWPAFSAYSTGTSMTNGVYVKVTFDTERYDTNNNFASSRFTPTVAGYYQINSHLVYLTTSSVGQVVLALYKNGVAETYTNLITDTTNGSSINLSYLIYMNGSTDYLEIYFYMSASGTLSVQAGAQSTFNGFLARAA
jgi:hypothetical protein